MNHGGESGETRTHVHDDVDETHSRVVVFWKGAHAECPLPRRGEIVIGRDKGLALSVPHDSVSRRHARIVVDGTIMLEDLGSSNGTMVDGQRLEPNRARPIGPGSVVKLGATDLVVHLAPAKAAPKSAAPPLSGTIDEVRAYLARVAPGEISVLLLGETGVGKGVLAEEMHRASRRANGPWVHINSAAIPESLMESEIFGSVKGAFTGADRDRSAFTGAVESKPGLLEVASGGTVFLDELGELSMPIQAKLLIALERREVQRVGAVKPRPIDVRIVAATNRDLSALIAASRFRADLYYRLAGVTLRIPPLRERRNEIIALSQGFLAALGPKLGRTPPGLPGPTADVLLAYSWPGNIRELKNVIERAALLADGHWILPEHLQLDRPPIPAGPLGATLPPPAVLPEIAVAPASSSAGSLRGDLERIEKERIQSALAECAGNQTRAAKLLGMSRRALVNRLDAYAIQRPKKSV